MRPRSACASVKTPSHTVTLPGAGAWAARKADTAAPRYSATTKANASLEAPHHAAFESLNLDIL